MIRDLIHRIAEAMPARKKRAREWAEARAEAAETTRREAEVDTEVRHAYSVAHKLAAHRRQNHFADRMRAAYGRREGHT